MSKKKDDGLVYFIFAVLKLLELIGVVIGVVLVGFLVFFMGYFVRYLLGEKSPLVGTDYLLVFLVGVIIVFILAIILPPLYFAIIAVVEKNLEWARKIARRIK